MVIGSGDPGLGLLRDYQLGSSLSLVFGLSSCTVSSTGNISYRMMRHRSTKSHQTANELSETQTTAVRKSSGQVCWTEMKLRHSWSSGSNSSVRLTRRQKRATVFSPSASNLRYERADCREWHPHDSSFSCIFHGKKSLNV